jgi:enterochelin esterase-like enzyme
MMPVRLLRSRSSVARRSRAGQRSRLHRRVRRSARQVPAGLVDIEFDSKVTGGKRPTSVYLPPGYSRDKTPVLYLFSASVATRRIGPARRAGRSSTI